MVAILSSSCHFLPFHVLPFHSHRVCHALASVVMVARWSVFSITLPLSASFSLSPCFFFLLSCCLSWLLTHFSLFHSSPWSPPTLFPSHSVSLSVSPPSLQHPSVPLSLSSHLPFSVFSCFLPILSACLIPTSLNPFSECDSSWSSCQLGCSQH